MSILVVGAGATGGYFGGRLAQAGRDVTFLVREGRAAALRERGLRIVGPGGTETIKPALATAVPPGAVADVVLVTVKADGLDAVIPQIRPAVGPRTTIVPVLNGMRHLSMLNGAFGRSSVLGGVALLSTQLDADGDIRQLNDWASLTIGAQDRQPTEAVERARDLLSGAAFPVTVSDDIVAAMWQKWTFIAAAGAVTCLLGGSVGEIVAVDGGEKMTRAIVEETRSIAAAAGYPVPDGALSQTVGTLTTPGSPFTSSLYRDLRQGRPVEVETILGDLVAEGRKAGVHSPLLDAATVALRVHNASASATSVRARR
ncbi:MAG TPA: ketopantoate reductase family protein [Trebonia sp.]|nr:ketopantoate reductase family protein [Trebonia sp.]